MLVANDLLGLDTSFKPRFVRRFAELESPIVGAVKDYVAAVRDGSFPASEHSFHRKRRGPSKVARLY